MLVSYAVALVTGAVDFEAIAQASWLGVPLHKESMGLFAIDGSPEFISALFTILPIALATMMEHVGDVAAISATVGHNYINDPGLNRTLMGDGLATTLAGLLGGPANTTYGENTGVLALSKYLPIPGHPHCGRHGHRSELQPQVRGRYQHHSHGYHWRYQLCAVRHDLCHRRAQCGGEPCGLYQQPQPDRCSSRSWSALWASTRWAV